MNEAYITAPSVTSADERDGDIDNCFALDTAPLSPSVDAARLTPGQQLLMQQVKQMTAFLG